MTRVLLVDDEPNLTWTMAQFLSRQGYETDTASDYESAVGILGAKKFDVAIVDIILPGKSGIDLLKQIAECGQGVSVVLMTGQPDVERIPEILRSGACNYLQKPVVKDTLIKAVSDAVDNKRRADEKLRNDQIARNHAAHLEILLKERTGELESAKALLNLVLDDCSDPILATDPGGLVTLYNPAALEFFGLEAEALGGHPAAGLFVDSQCASGGFAEWITQADADGIFRTEIDFRRKDGRVSSAEIAAAPIHAPIHAPAQIEAEHEIGHVIIVRNLGGQGHHPHAPEAGERSVDNTQTGEMTRAAAQIAHEVKNPLAGLHLYSAHLRSKMTGRADKGQIELVDKIISTLNHLSGVVERTLDFSRPIHLNLTRADLRQVMRDALRLVEPQLAVAGVAVRRAFPAVAMPCRVDESYIRQAFVNLLLNAMEAATDQREVNVILDCDGDTLKAEVVDRGCGISQEQLAQIFEPFYTTKAKGLGLGLPFARKVIEAHQGKISIESRPRGGTRVIVRLPAEN